MYDKIKIWVDVGSVGEYYSCVPQCLERYEVRIDPKSGIPYGIGSLHGLRVTIYINGISIIGSLPKYKYGNNIYPIDRTNTKLAIEEIEDSMHISFADAKVTGLEFGANFVMSHPVIDYLNLLGEYPRRRQVREYQYTSYWQTSDNSKVFVIYDKISEAKEHKLVIPNGLEDANILRAELRLNGGLPKKIGVPEVKPSTLYDLDFCRKCMKMFQQEYFNIKKINAVKTNPTSQIHTVNDAFEYVVCMLMRQQEESGRGKNDSNPIDKIMQKVKDEKVFNNRTNYSRLKAKLESVKNNPKFTCKSDLIKELDDSFKNAGAYI